MVHLKQNQQGAARSLRSWAASRRRTLIGWSVLIVAFVVRTLTVGLSLSEDTVMLWLAAYPMLILLFFWRRASRPVRLLLVGYVLAMALAFSLVYTGEHFVADEVAGWACAIAVYFAGSRLLNWHRDRRQRAGTGSVVPAGQPADTVLVDGEAAVPG